ncbi:TPA: HigA family addiction module antitoxin [Vibrio cholerae]|jgi:addiction module HigA family antidote|uniref:HigA family addiction module antitoxin n=1 Tax=Shewanella indica TaxID=768528 RepID=UPI000D21E8AE|nr:HigA family addiction module antitoxin [Vibrio parahaemolyticus]AVW96079.1 addiction module antidote protein, HigA family [Vibrio parahaemolyticus]EGQ8904294.1 HigA family addiction module antidote protein [Vibrio parahaemolyticus]EJG1193111.1 HigA family addiction module antidote protein [Vibrio parahaemolyticus]
MTMHNPAHPGEILKELIIEPFELTITDVAEHLNVSRKTLSNVLNGRGAITPEMAVRLELAFAKPSADHWLRLQNAYDLSALRNQKTTLKVQSHELA